MAEKEGEAEKREAAVHHHHYYFGEPAAGVVSGLAGRIGRLPTVATYCDCSTCACGSCACNCSCNACGACYCDCSCSGIASIAQRDFSAIATLVEGLNVELGEIRQIVAGLKERGK